MREEDQITVILRIFYLHQFLNETKVSNDYLTKMQTDFDAIRSAGVKCIVRFSYSDSQNAETWDATPDKVLSHIESLREVVGANTDVILSVQAGFIGAWGEWYYTENFAGNGFVPDENDQDNRRAVVEALLDILPESIQVQLRTPGIKQAMVENDQPISDEEAYSGSKLSRVAHHNDCFLANGTDYGTYTQLSADLAYLEQDTKYAIAGGETCDGSNSYSDCDAGMPRMKLLHWTYLNRDYNRDVYDKWEKQGCHDSVTMMLGYRLALKSSTLENIAEAGDTAAIEFEFENIGFAAPTQAKPVQIILRRKNINPAILKYEGTNKDIRFWQPGNIILEESLKLPDSLSDGNYEVGIRIPDQAASISGNPAYCVQFANLGLWDQLHGINWLNQFITVGKADTLIVPHTPDNLTAITISDEQIDLSWSNSSADEVLFELYRSENGSGNWELIYAGEIGSETYSDFNVSPGNTYTYIIRAVNAEAKSDWSEEANASIEPSLTLFIEEDNILIYPNPLQGNTLNIKGEIQSVVLITVYDCRGIKLFEKEYASLPAQINNLGLKSGLYLVSVSTGNCNIVSRLMVD
jgi:hypothetical protein